MATQAPWFVRERAEWFASLALTKHNEVKVTAYSGEDMPIELLVEIHKGGRPTFRFFGVRIHADIELPDRHNGEVQTASHLNHITPGAALPICELLVGVRKPEGLYRWVLEPVVEGGRPRLEPGHSPWQPLDEAGVDRLIGQVNAWYEASNGLSNHG